MVNGFVESDNQRNTLKSVVLNMSGDCSHMPSEHEQTQKAPNRLAEEYYQTWLDWKQYIGTTD